MRLSTASRFSRSTPRSNGRERPALARPRGRVPLERAPPALVACEPGVKFSAVTIAAFGVDDPPAAATCRVGRLDGRLGRVSGMDGLAFVEPNLACSRRTGRLCVPADLISRGALAPGSETGSDMRLRPTALDVAPAGGWYTHPLGAVTAAADAQGVVLLFSVSQSR
jgi:hypothetical protein